MNQLGYFEIQSSDPEREIAFYTALFGWTFNKQDGAPLPYYHIETATLYGGLMKRPAPKAAAGSSTNAFTCSFQVDDFDGMAQKITSLGGAVFMPKFAIPGRCWQGYFLDTDQNVFGIFEADEKAGV